MEDYAGKGTTLRDFLRVVFRHKSVVISSVIVVMVVVSIRLELKTPIYSAQVKVLVSGKMLIEADYYEEIKTGPGWLIFSQMEMVKSRSVIERVVKYLKLHERPLDYERNFSSRLKAFLIDRRVKKQKLILDEMTPEQKEVFLFDMAMSRLEGILITTPLKDTNIFMISVRDFSPVQAAVIANSISRSFIIFDIEQQIAELRLKYGDKNVTLIQLQNHIKDLYKTLDGKLLTDIEAIGPASVKVIQQAHVGGRVKGISKNLTRFVSFFMSMFFGILLAFVFDYIDQTFRTPWDVEGFLNLPVLFSIPKRKPGNKLLISYANPRTTNYTQSFLKLSDHMYLLMKDKNVKTLLITDVEGSDETAAVIANLGTYLAHEAGHRVLIIDANLRVPLMSKIFNISNSTGLINVLDEKIPFEDAIKDLGSHLHVLPAGEAVTNPITLLNSSYMSDVIKKAKEQYEIVFINCINLNKFSDAVILSSIADGTILIVNEGRVNRQAVKSAIAPLEQKKVNIVGVIFNNRTYVIPDIIYKLT